MQKKVMINDFMLPFPSITKDTYIIISEVAFTEKRIIRVPNKSLLRNIKNCYFHVVIIHPTII